MHLPQDLIPSCAPLLAPGKMDMPICIEIMDWNSMSAHDLIGEVFTPNSEPFTPNPEPSTPKPEIRTSSSLAPQNPTLYAPNQR